MWPAIEIYLVVLINGNCRSASNADDDDNNRKGHEKSAAVNLRFPLANYAKLSASTRTTTTMIITISCQSSGHFRLPVFCFSLSSARLFSARLVRLPFGSRFASDAQSYITSDDVTSARSEGQFTTVDHNNNNNNNMTRLAASCGAKFNLADFAGQSPKSRRCANRSVSFKSPR